MSDRKWTVDDVQRLVALAEQVVADCERQYGGYSTNGAMYRSLVDALTPFQTDPDAELVKAIQDIRFEPAQDFSPIRVDATRRIIAAVRDHDAKAVAK